MKVSKVIIHPHALQRLTEKDAQERCQFFKA